MYEEDLKAAVNGAVTGMAEAMATLHVLFLSLIDGGFTEDQALKIIAGVMVGAGESNR